MAENNELIEPKPKPWMLSGYGALGACLACFLDYFMNDTAAVSLKIKSTLAKHFFEGANPHGLIVVLFISALGFLLCRMKLPANPYDAFARGLSVFTIFTLATPYSGEVKSQDPIPVTGMMVKEYSILQTHTSIFQIQANATIRLNDWVSSCKPSYAGPLGLNSFLNNSINYCPTDIKLQPNQRVEILRYWDTSMRGYRYAEIKFVNNGNEVTGWVWAGKNPDYWHALIPDDEKSVENKRIE
jgi:hypothetical protein